MEDKTLFEIIELLEESLAKQEAYINGLFRKAARRMVSHYETGLEDGAKLTKNDGISCGTLSYMKTIEKK